MQVPAELLAQHYFVERPEGAAERETRLAREAACGEPIAPVRRFNLTGRARRGCVFHLEDATADESAAAADAEPFDLILCRYSIFLYCDERAARRALSRLTARLAPHGVLVLGSSDQMPQGASELIEPVPPAELGGAPTADLLDLYFERPPRLANAWRLRRRAPTLAAAASLEANASADGALGGEAARRLAATVGALRGAASLCAFRRALGLRAGAFAAAAESPKVAARRRHGLRGVGPRPNGRSTEIMRAKGGHYNAPLVERAAECERRRQERLAQLRVDRDAAERALRSRRPADAQHVARAAMSPAAYHQ